MTHILIADPDSRTRQALALLLERRLGIPGADEAWDRTSLERQLTTSAPDALLLDCHLPGLSAADMAALAMRPGCGRLALMSVDAADAAVAQGLRAAFIYKGALPEEVMVALRALIPA